MRFLLVPNLATLDDLEWHDRPQVCVISLNLVAFGAHKVKLVEDTPKLSPTEM